jgi:hypothetical protein
MKPPMEHKSNCAAIRTRRPWECDCLSPLANQEWGWDTRGPNGTIMAYEDEVDSLKRLVRRAVAAADKQYGVGYGDGLRHGKQMAVAIFAASVGFAALMTWLL